MTKSAIKGKGVDNGSGWKPFTPTYTAMISGPRTFREWLLRKPRLTVKLPTPTGLYKREGKKVYINFPVNTTSSTKDKGKV